MLGFGNEVLLDHFFLPILSVKRENAVDMDAVLFVPSPPLAADEMECSDIEKRQIY